MKTKEYLDRIELIGMQDAMSGFLPASRMLHRYAEPEIVTADMFNEMHKDWLDETDQDPRQPCEWCNNKSVMKLSRGRKVCAGCGIGVS